MTRLTRLATSCVVVAGVVMPLAPASATPRHAHHHRHHFLVATDHPARRAVFPVPGFTEATTGASWLGGVLDAGISAPVSADPYEYRTHGYYRDGRSGQTLYGPGYDYYGND